MKKAPLSRALAALFLALLAASPPLKSQDTAPLMMHGERIVALVESGGRPCLVTTETVYFWRKKKWWAAVPAPHGTLSATAVADRLWLATERGLYYFSEGMPSPVEWRGPGDLPLKKAVTGIGGASGKLSVGAAGEVFTLDGTAFSQKWMDRCEPLAICGCGDFTWVGTPVGLFRIDGSGQIQRYSEEGVIGFEVPDNIVEGLFCSKNQLLTVVMSEALAFFPLDGGTAPAHGEHFEFIGEPGNLIFSQIETPSGDLLFLTEKGVFRLSTAFLKEDREHAASVEVHSDAGNPVAERLPVGRLLGTDSLDREKWKSGFFDRKGRLWLAGEATVVRIEADDLILSREKKNR